MHRNGFEIYKVDLEKQRVVQLNTLLGDDALLIGHSYTCFLSTKSYPKLLPNHVYFTDDSEYWLVEKKHIRLDVGVYNLEDESSHDVVTPQHWLNWPIPYGLYQVFRRSTNKYVFLAVIFVLFFIPLVTKKYVASCAMVASFYTTLRYYKHFLH